MRKLILDVVGIINDPFKSKEGLIYKLSPYLYCPFKILVKKFEKFSKYQPNTSLIYS